MGLLGTLQAQINKHCKRNKLPIKPWPSKILVPAELGISYIVFLTQCRFLFINILSKNYHVFCQCWSRFLLGHFWTLFLPVFFGQKWGGGTFKKWYLLAGTTRVCSARETPCAAGTETAASAEISSPTSSRFWFFKLFIVNINKILTLKMIQVTFCWNQCCGSGMFFPGSRIWIFPFQIRFFPSRIRIKNLSIVNPKTWY